MMSVLYIEKNAAISKVKIVWISNRYIFEQMKCRITVP